MTSKQNDLRETTGVVRIKSAAKVSDQMISMGVSRVETQGTLSRVREPHRAKECQCANCGKESHCRKREFSVKAWTVLLLWNEINSNSVNQPICQDCYQEMREILIDRSDEIDEVMADSGEVEKVQGFLSAATGLAS